MSFWNNTPSVIARDRTTGWILLGGLGSLGVEEMWFLDDGERYAQLAGYTDAPERLRFELPRSTEGGR